MMFSQKFSTPVALAWKNQPTWKLWNYMSGGSVVLIWHKAHSPLCVACVGRLICQKRMGFWHTQGVLIEVQLVASSWVLCIEKLSPGCSGWIVFWLYGEFSTKCTIILPAGDCERCCDTFVKRGLITCSL